jgi:hypothetical protein
VKGGEIVTLIDLEALGKNRIHDLTTLLINAWTNDNDEQAVVLLLEHIEKVASPRDTEISLSSCMLGVLAFICEHNPKDGDALAPRFFKLLHLV